ncbi:MAG: alpha/beta hydrolase [Nitratireductor sp.]
MKLLLLLFVGAILALYGASQYLARQVASQYPPKGRFADVGDVRLHYTDYAADGDADLLPLVFIHGASGNLREQEGIILDQLKGRGRLIFLDRPGHGYSSRGSANDMHLPAGQARIVSGLLSAIGVEKAILVGHSLGGAVAAAFAVNHPDQLAGIVFLTPATHPWPGGKVTWYYHLTRMPVIGWLFSELLAVPGGHLRYHDGVAEVFAPQDTPAAYERNSATRLVLRPHVFRYNAMDVTSLYDAVSALSPSYGKIDAPVSIVTGDSDEIVLAEVHSVGLERDIDGAKLVWLPGEGHSPAWTNPQAVIGEIERVSTEAKARSGGR